MPTVSIKAYLDSNWFKNSEPVYVKNVPGTDILALGFFSAVTTEFTNL